MERRLPACRDDSFRRRRSVGLYLLVRHPRSEFLTIGEQARRLVAKRVWPGHLNAKVSAARLRSRRRLFATAPCQFRHSDALEYNRPSSRASATGQGDLRCPPTTMPELSSAGSGLACRVVQDRGASALSGASGTGLPFVPATCRVSEREDRAGTAWCVHGHAACGSSGSVGCIPGDLGGRNAARLYVCGRRREPVRGLLEPPRSPASRRAPTSETRWTLIWDYSHRKRSDSWMSFSMRPPPRRSPGQRR